MQQKECSITWGLLLPSSEANPQSLQDLKIYLDRVSQQWEQARIRLKSLGED